MSVTKMTSISLKENDLPMPVTATSKKSSRLSKLTIAKVVLAVFLVAGVLAAVGMCAAMLGVHSRGSTEPKATERDGYDLFESDRHHSEEELYRRMAENSRIPRRTRGGPSQMCISNVSNETIPAAHVRGWGEPFKPTPQTPSLGATSTPIIPGHNTKWECNDGVRGPAYVDGGMIFNQTDKSLYVPMCGYYHIASQLYFQVERLKIDGDKDTSVRHQMKVERNCAADDQELVIEGYSYLRRSTAHATITNTHTQAIVKMCRGGRLKVIVPNENPCCSTGETREATFITAFLVKETPCENTWPAHIQSC